MLLTIRRIVSSRVAAAMAGRSTPQERQHDAMLAEVAFYAFHAELWTRRITPSKWSRLPADKRLPSRSRRRYCSNSMRNPRVSLIKWLASPDFRKAIIGARYQLIFTLVWSSVASASRRFMVLREKSIATTPCSNGQNRWVHWR